MDEEMIPLLILLGTAMIIGIIIAKFGEDIVKWGGVAFEIK